MKKVPYKDRFKYNNIAEILFSICGIAEILSVFFCCRNRGERDKKKYAYKKKYPIRIDSSTMALQRFFQYLWHCRDSFSIFLTEGVLFIMFFYGKSTL